MLTQSETGRRKVKVLILRSIKVDFKFVGYQSHFLPRVFSDRIQPMTWPDRVSVYHKLREAPNASTDSFILDVLILSEKYQRPAARCVEDIVVYDYQDRSKAPLRDFMVERFKQTFALQEAAKAKNEAKVKDLLQKVERLERASWDRPDAVEDMGTKPSINKTARDKWKP